MQGEAGQLVVLVRVCGNVFALKREAGRLLMRKLRTNAPFARPLDQRAAIDLLRGR